MTKVVRKGIKKAVIIYEDPDLKEGRRVIFGHFPTLMGFMLEQLPIVWKRLQKMAKREFNSPFEMLEYYKEIKEDWAKTHGAEAADNMEMTLTYEVKKVK